MLWPINNFFPHRRKKNIRLHVFFLNIRYLENNFNTLLKVGIIIFWAPYKTLELAKTFLLLNTMVKEAGLVSCQLETILCTTDNRLLRTCKLLPCQQFPVNKIILVIQFYFFIFTRLLVWTIWEFFFSLFPYPPQCSQPDPTSLTVNSKKLTWSVASHFSLSNKFIHCQWKRWSFFFPLGLPWRSPNQLKRKEPKYVFIHTHTYTQRHTLNKFIHTEDLIWTRDWE